jgi:uncharacterized membrane protein
MLAGAGWGVLAWIAALSTYLICLLVYDWTQRHKRPKSQDGLMWFELSVWAVFLVSVTLTLWIGRRLFV